MNFADDREGVWFPRLERLAALQDEMSAEARRRQRVQVTLTDRHKPPKPYNPNALANSLAKAFSAEPSNDLALTTHPLNPPKHAFFRSNKVDDNTKYVQKLAALQDEMSAEARRRQRFQVSKKR